MATSAKVHGARGDEDLARAAVAGDGQAFAELYDRHEQRVYRFCVRLLGNPDDAADATQETFMRLLKRLPALEGRELNVIAYVLTAARHACYDTIDARKRLELTGEEIEPSGAEPGAIDEDPERAALLATTRELAQRAHARLPARQREVLALRELEGLSYEEIGEVMEIKPNAVAQLIARARIGLGELVRGDALESVAGATPDCDRALPLLARGQDSQTLSGEDGNWLLGHLRDCATCRVRESTMQEAGVSYRALAPIVPLVWLRHVTIARAAELVGADWSELAGPHPHAGHGLTGERLGLHSRRRRLAGLTLLAACLIGLVALVGSISRDGAAPDARTLTATPVGAITPDGRSVHKGAGQPQHRVVVHRLETVHRVLAGGRVVSVKVPVTSTILVGTTTPRTTPGAKTVHRKTHRHAARSTPTPVSSPTPPVTTTVPSAPPPTTTTTPAPVPTTTSPVPTTSTPTTPTTPTTTNPNTPPPTETNPNTPPGTLNPG
jgi:RNA polymerase sigma factor (sigma-70 family)